MEDIKSDVARMAANVDEERDQSLIDSFSLARPRYVAFCDSMRLLVQRLCENSGFSATVESRAKEVSNLAEKLKRKRGYATLDDIPDLAGVRIIVRYSSEVAQVAEMLSREFLVIESFTHDYSSPDSFGYRSHHMVVALSNRRSRLTEWTDSEGLRAEVQIRTILQHAWASISHSLDYKSESDIPQDLRRDLFKVAALLESADDSFERYRQSVGLLKRHYAEEQNWRSLPIDIYSLRSHWPKLPQRPISDACEALGVKIRVGERVADEILLALARGAAMARIQTLGELEDFINTADLREYYDRFLVALDNREAFQSVNGALMLLGVFCSLDHIASSDRDYILGIQQPGQPEMIKQREGDPS
ncbi:GTP pyrophosphokinase [Micromonospora sp. URMC 105]|uniref:GTP pyrophosphokinase n=1 Tax=Micromonospora sp. URMC 105 TaxID=3423413 RepID=UPI003F1B9D86